MVRQRVRIRFCKLGDLRLIGHRDLMRCMERLFRRAGLPLKMSEGFHPKPRMTFPSALAVGIESTDEVMELELARPCSADQVLAQISEHAPPGLTPQTVETLPQGCRKARVRSVRYQVPVPPPLCDGLAERISRLTADPSRLIERTGGKSPVELGTSLEKLTLQEDLLVMQLHSTSGASARPRDILAALELADLELQGVHLTRTAVEIEP